MIILEGPDLAGKTTLANQLVAAINSRETGCAIFQRMTRLPDGFDRYRGYLRLMNRDVVMDRFHMSEIAYQYAREDAINRLPSEQYRIIDAHLRLIGAVTVVVIPSEEQIRTLYRTHAQREMYTVDKILRARDAYEKLVSYQFHDYEPDFDLLIVNRFPNQQDLEDVLSIHEDRQDFLKSLD